MKIVMGKDEKGKPLAESDVTVALPTVYEGCVDFVCVKNNILKFFKDTLTISNRNFTFPYVHADQANLTFIASLSDL